VTDFGLAKLVEGEDLSQSHDLVGTLRYMAPERFRGITDRRSDITHWARRCTSSWPCAPPSPSGTRSC
jgi:serine/threonine protein kinase